MRDASTAECRWTYIRRLCQACLSYGSRYAIQGLTFHYSSFLQTQYCQRLPFPHSSPLLLSRPWKLSQSAPAYVAMAVLGELSNPTSVSSVSLEKPPLPVIDDIEAVKEVTPEWKPQKQEYLVMVTLSVISLMVALDATILVTVLPVSPPLQADLHVRD